LNYLKPAKFHGKIVLNYLKFNKASATNFRSGQDPSSRSIPFGKHVRDVTVRDKVLSTTDCHPRTPER